MGKWCDGKGSCLLPGQEAWKAAAAAGQWSATNVLLQFVDWLHSSLIGKATLLPHAAHNPRQTACVQQLLALDLSAGGPRPPTV